jgi:DNA-binding response OmpR family regulator
MNNHVLILEDDLLLGETLEDYLETEGFEPSRFMDSKKALEACYSHIFGLYLLDINVPGVNGLEFLKLLRQSGDETPAIYITSAKDTPTLVKGFESGADDYIKKPFDLEELSCRIRAVLERNGHLKEKIKIDDTYMIDLRQKVLCEGANTLMLNPKDFELLVLLVENRGKVVTKEAIAKRLWSASEGIHEGALRVYINNLKKIFGKDSIENIRGVGYRFGG